MVILMLELTEKKVAESKSPYNPKKKKKKKTKVVFKGDFDSATFFSVSPNISNKRGR